MRHDVELIEDVRNILFSRDVPSILLSLTMLKFRHSLFKIISTKHLTQGRHVIIYAKHVSGSR